jgi:hypothetical protein
LAADRPQGADRGALRRPAARALGRQGPAPARRSLSSGGRSPTGGTRLSVRPRHPKADEAAQAAFRQASPSW